jgi:hypothetical protein
MTPDILRIAQQPTGLRPGDRVRWRNPVHEGGPYRVVKVDGLRVTVERAVRGRGHRMALWTVHKNHVEMVR